MHLHVPRAVTTALLWGQSPAPGVLLLADLTRQGPCSHVHMHGCVRRAAMHASRWRTTRTWQATRCRVCVVDEDSWAIATAGVGTATSHGHAGSSNGSGRQDATAVPSHSGTVAFAAAAKPAPSEVPGAQSRDDAATGNGSAAVPAGAATPPAPATPVAPSTAPEEDMSWLTILEPVYIQRS